MLHRVIQSAIVLTTLIAMNASAFWVNQQFNGQWVEVSNADARRGLNIQFIKTGPRDRGALFITGFTFDNDGNQIWLGGTFSGVVPGEDTFAVSMALTSGGNFFGGPDGNFDTRIQDFATFTLKFNSCDSMDLNWQWNNNGGPDIGSGTVNMDRGSSSLGNILAVGSDQCVYQEPAPAQCPAFATADFDGRFCEISGRYTDVDITLSNNIVWVMNGPTFIGGANNTGAATVTIEPGTYIVGSSGSDALIIERGSKIFAAGTPTAPIVLTSATDIGTGTTPAPGDVGGLAIFGNAPTNACSAPLPACDAPFEGLPGSLFGGDNVDDSSGLIKYLQIRFAGNPIIQDEELNALSLAGVGAGTVIEFVQTDSGFDDGIEIFGGTVNLRNIVMSNIRDDSLDTDLGWQGSIQYGLIVQGDLSNDNGFEMDNNPNNNSAVPRSHPRLANITVIGTAPEGEGWRLRTGTSFNAWNMFISGSGEGCVNIDDNETFNNGGIPSALSGNLTVAGSAIGSCGQGAFEDTASDPFLISDWWNAQNNLIDVNPQFVPGTVFPSQSSVLIDGGVAPVGDFFDKTTYIGAFRDANDRWIESWTTGLDDAIQNALGQ